MKNFTLIAFIGLVAYCGEINSKTFSVTLDSCSNCGKICASIPNSTVNCEIVPPTNPAHEGSKVTVTHGPSFKCYSKSRNCVDQVYVASPTTGASYLCQCLYGGQGPLSK